MLTGVELFEIEEASLNTFREFERYFISPKIVIIKIKNSVVVYNLEERESVHSFNFFPFGKKKNFIYFFFIFFYFFFFTIDTAYFDYYAGELVIGYPSKKKIYKINLKYPKTPIETQFNFVYRYSLKDICSRWNFILVSESGLNFSFMNV